MPVLIIIALIVALGGGASIAAENALPGDALYPVKISVNENVHAALAFSTEAKASGYARLAARRLSEAEQLAAKSRLDTDAAMNIEARFEAHAQRFRELAAQLAAKSGAAASVAAHSEFEASLRAHEDALARIQKQRQEIRTEVGQVLASVRSSLGMTARARAQAEADLVAENKTSPEARVAAEGKMKAAQNKIAEVQAFIDNVEARIGASATTQAEAQLKLAESAVAEGNAKIESETYTEAFVLFQKAIRIAQEGKTLVQIQTRVDIDLSVGSMGIEANSKTDMRGEGAVESDSKADSSSGGLRIEGSAGAEAEADRDGTEATSSGELEVEIGL